ncbi:hypothetical protein ACVNIS_06445 [Sphaerotilaceae bacterium SBD11-9]
MYPYDQQQLSPEVIQAVLALQSQPSGQRSIDAQMKRAQMLRDSGLVGLQSTSPGGGRAGAPNWAGALSNVYAGYKARGMEEDAALRQREQDARRERAMAKYFEALSGQRMPRESYPGSEGE